MTYRLEGRKMEEWAGELGNVARHKRALTNWRGGRGRSGLVSLETRHIINEESQTGREEERGGGLRVWKQGTSQMKTHQLDVCSMQVGHRRLAKGEQHK